MVEITCNTCKKLIVKKELVRYTGVGGYRKCVKHAEIKNPKNMHKKSLKL